MDKKGEDAAIALIDYGAGNLHSVHNALKAAGADNIAVTDNPDIVRGAARIVLPGVGAFAACYDGLARISGMIDALEQRVLGDKAPFLGICVGMQLLAEYGHEYGKHQGLGWIKGDVRALQPSEYVKVPHMGWNDVVLQGQPPLLEAGEAYFLHSYYFEAANEVDIAATTDHGGKITAAVAKDNILGVQFHPEKSQQYGINLLQRFLRWMPEEAKI